MDFEVREGERLDDLVRDGMRILQRADEFCFSVDAVLLAHFVRVRKRDRIADLGTGTGVIPLLLSAFGARDVTAIERNPVMAALAERNVRGNHKEDVIRVVQADYCRARQHFPSGAFTSVVVNPPYREVGTGHLSAKAGVAAACHELTATLADVFAAAKYLLAYGGLLTMVHRADRLADLLYEGRLAGMEAKRIRFVCSHEGEEASRVLIEWKHGGGAGLHVEAPLIVHRADGSYTDEVLEIYGKKEEHE